MRVTRLRAENVHGYLPIDISFFDDITFMTGVNGSGKTSALRLLMALLTPNLEELSAISFSAAEVTIQEGDIEIVVSSEKTLEGITIRINKMTDCLVITSSDLEIYMEIMRRREEQRSPIIDKLKASPIYQKLQTMSTPMFLGLDRRFYAPSMPGDELNETRKREYMTKRIWSEDPSFRGTAVAAGLAQVNYLVVTRMQEVRAAQEQLDERLRAQFFKKAFEYNPSNQHENSARLPSRAELDRYRQQLTKIEKAAEGLKLPVPEIQSALTDFFERMSVVVASLEKSANQKVQSKKTTDKKATIRIKGDLHMWDDAFFIEWIINKPQADRILEHLRMLDEYIESRNALRDPITRFLTLVNSFLTQTRKQVSVEGNGHLAVKLQGGGDTRPISALSSGERQLLVMLAHLSLNPNLSGSGVFIVDEPELSLHIDWQERFVDAIREANPKVQLILATHSPAIILDRTDACRDLSEALYA